LTKYFVPTRLLAFADDPFGLFALFSTMSSLNRSPYDFHNDDDNSSIEEEEEEPNNSYHYNYLAASVQSVLSRFQERHHGDDGDTPPHNTGGGNAYYYDPEEEEDSEEEALTSNPLLDLLPASCRSHVNNKRLPVFLAGIVALVSMLGGSKHTPFHSIKRSRKRPDFVYHHPYVSSSYYSSTSSIETLIKTEQLQVRKVGSKSIYQDREFKTNLAVVRPFCEFDAEALPSTFSVWNQLPPCRTAANDLDLDDMLMMDTNSTEKSYFDQVGTTIMQDKVADVFLFYSQTFSENDVAMQAVDTILNQFNEPGGWSQCFRNIYAIEANIPQELDLYIPSAQEELYNWVNGPNRQFEAAFRIIQSGEWGDYDGFYLMEGDSIPIKNHWLDVVLSEVEENRPFAILGA
jgi:hypothetical protein